MDAWRLTSQERQAAGKGAAAAPADEVVVFRTWVAERGVLAISNAALVLAAAPAEAGGAQPVSGRAGAEGGGGGGGVGGSARSRL